MTVESMPECVGDVVAQRQHDVDEYIRLRRSGAALAGVAEESLGPDFAMLVHSRMLANVARAEGYAKGFEAGQQSKAGADE